jgi:diaminopimelate epimerase
MPLHFTKLHGLGNDYVYIDVHDQHVPDPIQLARAVSNRHRGIGSDGLILIAPPTDEADADVRMLMFNADGTPGEMCGNGIRCLAKYVYDHGRAHQNPLRVETGAGTLLLDLTTNPDDQVTTVRVDMGPPRLAPRDIPIDIPGEEAVNVPINVADHHFQLTAVSMGNPHAVVFVDDVAAIPLETVGPAFEHHPLFPQRVNVHFAQLRDRHHLQMRTWERGSGITQACGTGACAVCVAGVLTRRAEPDITARLPGGELHILWDQTTRHIFMTGPATEVFSGTWPD